MNNFLGCVLNGVLVTGAGTIALLVLGGFLVWVVKDTDGYNFWRLWRIPGTIAFFWIIGRVFL